MSAPWGSGVYGIGYWGEGNQDATVTFEAWGQGSWGANAWGIGNVTTALTTNINSVVIAIDNVVSINGNQLKVYYEFLLFIYNFFNNSTDQYCVRAVIV